jgi:hypothetical protein
MEFLITLYLLSEKLQDSRTPVILMGWGGEPSGYAENSDSLIFL